MWSAVDVNRFVAMFPTVVILKSNQFAIKYDEKLPNLYEQKILKVQEERAMTFFTCQHFLALAGSQVFEKN